MAKSTSGVAENDEIEPISLRCSCGCDHIALSVIIKGVWIIETDSSKCKCPEYVQHRLQEPETPIPPRPHINYGLYIRSSAWGNKASAAKRRARQRCQVCNDPVSRSVLDAHHRTYERLGYEDPEDITILCRECHTLYSRAKKLKKFVI